MKQTEVKKSILIECRVRPRSSRQGIVLEADGFFKIHLHSAPEDNKANCELRKLLSGKLRISQSSIEIVQGAKSKNKVLRLKGIDKKDIEAIFKPLGVCFY